MFKFVDTRYCYKDIYYNDVRRGLLYKSTSGKWIAIFDGNRSEYKSMYTAKVAIAVISSNGISLQSSQ
jgi:hypothetical protein